MSSLIKLLPDHVANQIAAGEVIQRPASVVKELLDNALDAGSSQICLYVKEGGKALIQVVDNGCGMNAADARMCWERHATSKIQQTEDIFKIHTMGFRGEALASIASVAHVEMRTRRPEDELGTRIQIEGSKLVLQEDFAGESGTSIAVKNLFYNIPARRNFLKSNPVEYKHVLEEFNRAALANPEIGFQLFHNDEEQINLESGSMENRILELINGATEGNLLEVDEETSVVTITGFVGSPEFARKMRGDQYFFVNRRFVRDPYLNHAVVNAYEGLISKEQFPLYVLHIQIDPALIDVNIHPSKTEIKFEDERNVYQILRAVTRKALGKLFKAPELPGLREDNQFMFKEIERVNNPSEFSEFKPVSTVGSSSKNWDDFKAVYQEGRSKSNRGWENLFPERNLVQPVYKEETVGHVGNPEPDEIVNRSFFQVHQQYIVTQIKRGLMLIDQQAAHERILFERYLLALDKNPVVSQQLLFPKTVILPAQDELVLLEILDDIRKLGFNISHFGKNTFVVNGLPAELHLGNEQDLLEEVVESYRTNKLSSEEKNKKVARTLAIKAAIKKGTRMQIEEMSRLVDELFACKEPAIAPDGRASIRMLSLDELAELFVKSK
ncbi:MAG: DNA mismatch repair endonuclease MutL [Bacteroidetes bacterium]|nr:DNA mismatch repair endonuclease MutL [Bacteroidota bacterium]